MVKNSKGKTLLLVGLLLLGSKFAHGESYKNCNTYRYSPRSYTMNYNFSTEASTKRYTYRWQSLKDFYKYYEKIEKLPVVPSKRPITPKPVAPKPVTPKPVVPKPVVPEVEAPQDKTPTAPVENNDLSSTEKEVIRLVNIERSKAGLSPFETSNELSKVARIKSKDMADNKYFSHTSPTYGSPFDMMKHYNIKYNTAGENIAMGHLSAESVVKGWMNSPGHKANILNKNFNKIGVGAYTASNNTIYWTQMFTN